MAINNAQTFASEELISKGCYLVQRGTYVGGENDGQIKERALDYEEEISVTKLFSNNYSDTLIMRNRNGREFTVTREMDGYSIRYDFYSLLKRGCCADSYLTFDRESGEWLDGEQYRAKLA